MEQIKPNKLHLLAKDANLNINLALKSNYKEIDEFTNSKIISLSELSVDERNESTNYRIYGNINYVSFLRNKKIGYTISNELGSVSYPDTIQGGLENFFIESLGNTFFNLEEFFDLRIFRLKEVQNVTGDVYTEKLEAISKPSDYVLNHFSYQKNIYNERNYHFKFNTLNLDPYKLISLSSQTDNDVVYDNKVYLGFIPKVPFNLNIYEKLFYTTGYTSELDLNSDFNYSAVSFTDAQIDLINQGSYFFTRDEFKKLFLTKLDNFFKIYNLEINDYNINLNLRFIRNYLDIGNGDYNKKTPNVHIKGLNTANLDFTNVEGNFIKFDKENYTFNEIIEKEHTIKITLFDKPNISNENAFNSYLNQNYSAFSYNSFFDSVNNNNNYIKINFWFKYKPFHKIELKKYSQFLNEVDITRTDAIIPENAIIFDDNYVWRDILTYGDPDNYDRPFINNNHYVYNDIIFNLKPDLSDKNTAILINEFLSNTRDKGFIFDKNNISARQETKQTCKITLF
jgi:hypothetical protein